MRRWITLLAACGGAPAPVRVPVVEPAPPIARHPGNDTIPVDPIAVLAEPAAEDPVSWLVPGEATLEIGGPALESVANLELRVRVFETQGSQVRVAVALAAARFSVWTDRSHLLGIVLRDQRLARYQGGGGEDFSQDPMVIELRTGARVRRLAHKDQWTQVRYLGALEAEGWVPDKVLGDRAVGVDKYGRFPTGQPELMVVPGTVIRAEPRWAGRELAIMATDYFLDTVKAIDQSWFEVSYQNSDLRLHGFASKHDPPGRLHTPSAPPASPTSLSANHRAPSGTCLYAHEGGDAIGYLVGDQDIQLVATNPGWFTLTIDTPWGETEFAVAGPTDADLVPCAPAGSVPPPNAPTLVPPPTSP